MKKAGNALKKTGWIFVFACMVSLVLLPGVQAAEKITTAGSSTVRPIVDKAATAFKKTHPGVTFIVGGGGSSHGVKAVATGEVMIGQASRFIKEKEMKQYPDLVPFKIGLDGIAVIVNKNNPLNAITREQVQDIYTGRITNWKEIGGHDAPIMLVSKEEGRSTLELFLKYFDLEAKETGEGRNTVMVHKKKSDSAYSTATAKLIGPNKEAIASVSTKPDAIAYVSVGTAQQIAHKGGRIKLLDLDDVPATIENVGNETYPLRRPLHVITKGEPTGTVKQFIDFLLSNEGQKIVESLEFIKVL
jgi:phosphate transport system substrate-binding protein